MASVRHSHNSLIKVHAFGCLLSRLSPARADNICLCMVNEAAYESSGNPAYFGETIGRVANRVSGARLHLNGRSYELPANGDGGQNCLHGGTKGWGKRRWTGPVLESRIDGSGITRDNVQKFTYSSPHSEEGFPGNVEARAWWFAREESGEAIIEVEYEAEMLEEQPEGVEETVVAMTNHSYFNLSHRADSESPSLAGTMLTLPTTQHLVVDPQTNIPTGTVAPFSQHAVLKPDEQVIFGDNVPKLDHCFVLDTDVANIPLDTRNRPMRRCVHMMHPETSVHLVIDSTEPAFQVYTGDGIDVHSGPSADDVYYGSRSGIAVEPGRYTNAANQPEWKGMVTLRRGQKWGSRIRYTSWQHQIDGV